MKVQQIWRGRISNLTNREVKLPITGQGNNLSWDSSFTPTNHAYLPFKHDWDAKSYMITDGKKKTYKTTREMLLEIAYSMYSGDKNLKKKVTDNNYIVTTKTDFNCFLVVKQGDMYYLPDNQILDPLRIDNIYRLSEVHGESLSQLLKSLNEKRRSTKLVQSC